MILLSIKTKLGEKVQIVVERTIELLGGETSYSGSVGAPGGGGGRAKPSCARRRRLCACSPEASAAAVGRMARLELGRSSSPELTTRSTVGRPCACRRSWASATHVPTKLTRKRTAGHQKTGRPAHAPQRSRTSAGMIPLPHRARLICQFGLLQMRQEFMRCAPE